MAISPELAEFIDAPTTIDFVVRDSKSLEEFIELTPYLIPTQTLGGRYVILYTDQSNFDTIREFLSSSFVGSVPSVLGLMDRPALEASGIIQVHQQPFLDLQGSGVLIGIVDTGIDYTQDVFIYEDGTSKIQYIFDQTVRGNTPQGFYIGSEYTNAQINEALRAENPLEVVPEQDTVGHGTFLASVAAGRNTDGFIGAAPEAELIVVKLKQARPLFRREYLIPDGVEAYESTAIMLGIEYIVQKARELNRPVAICLGLGTNFGGSHDGLSLFEEYLSGVSNLAGVCLCIAAGNESQARHHAQGRIAASGEQENIDIRIEEDGANVFLTIWSNVSDRLSVSVRSPTGEYVERVPARSGVRMTTRLVLERTTVLIEYYFPLEGNSGQVSVVKLIDARPGIWTVTVHGDIVLDGSYHAWLPITGFIPPTVQLLSSSPYHTLTIPATAISIISCAAYNSYNNTLYINSSWGPTTLPYMAPTLAAPGVDVGGISPSGYTQMDGTSVAAAITTGAAALMLQWGIVQNNDPSLSTYQIRAYLIRGCDRIEGLDYPNRQWGYGTLNLLQSFLLMREMSIVQ